jgi:poly-gamma-glutamate synthesis protein (capsule biosynthesis protein)
MPTHETFLMTTAMRGGAVSSTEEPALSHARCGLSPKFWLVMLLLGGCATPRQLWFGGDVHLGTGGAERLRDVSAAMNAAGVVNLEGPIGTAEQAMGPRTDDEHAALRLVNGPGAARALALAGIVAAGIENNHAADLGDSGRAVTREALGKAGVAPFGVAVVNVGGVAVVLTALDLSGGVPASLAEGLGAARKRGQLLVATFHVTGPPSLLPAPELREAVEVALDAGAKIVIAHGTHAIAAVERRGEAVIAWGLGNLAFACECTDEADGLLLGVELDAEGGVTRATVVPVTAGLHGTNARLSENPKLTLDLLESLGSSALVRHGDRAEF